MNLVSIRKVEFSIIFKIFWWIFVSNWMRSQNSWKGQTKDDLSCLSLYIVISSMNKRLKIQTCYKSVQDVVQNLQDSGWSKKYFQDSVFSCKIFYIIQVKVKYSILHYSGKSKIILQYSRCSKIFWLRPPQSGLFQQMHLLHTESSIIVCKILFG